MGASQLGKFEPTPRYRAPLPGGEIFEKFSPRRGRGGLSEVITSIEMHPLKSTIWLLPAYFVHLQSGLPPLNERSLVQVD